MMDFFKNCKEVFKQIARFNEARQLHLGISFSFPKCTSYDSRTSFEKFKAEKDPFPWQVIPVKSDDEAIPLFSK